MLAFSRIEMIISKNLNVRQTSTPSTLVINAHICQLWGPPDTILDENYLRSSNIVAISDLWPRPESHVETVLSSYRDH